MLNKILYFVTPGPMNESFSFRARVFYSWITLGIVFALVFVIISLSSGQTIDIAGVLISIPAVVCLLGLFGLGIDSIRERNPKYKGWYWLLFPIITYLFIGFWLSVWVIGIIFAFMGIKLPKIDKPQFSKIDTTQFKQQTENSKLEDFLKDFKKEFEQLKLLQTENRLDPKQDKVVRKLCQFDTSKYNNRLKELFKEDEMDELILLLLMLLGAEVR